MHELGILCNIVEIVLKAVADHELTEVEAIVLQVGELSAVIPKYLHSCYPAAVDGTILKSTSLEVEIQSANAVCRKCNRVFAVMVNNGVCPHCESDDYEVISGQEFKVKELRAR